MSCGDLRIQTVSMLSEFRTAFSLQTPTSVYRCVPPQLPSPLRRNTVRFTPTQVEAIRAGTQPGLTLVVGPPGTGKTDVAVQIISNIYHNYPEQRTLIVTHSNQALNQLFEKIMALDIEERHLLRLGHGEEALETEKDFSRSVARGREGGTTLCRRRNSLGPVVNGGAMGKGGTMETKNGNVRSLMLTPIRFLF